MEMIDVLNSDGTLSGETASRDKIHEKGLWHRSVYVCVLSNKGEILLQRRSKNKKNWPCLWDISVGGHISAGDSSSLSAIREVEEEIGLTITQEDLEYLGTAKKEWVLDNGKWLDNEIHDVYILFSNPVIFKDIIIQKSELESVKYVPIEEFRKWVREQKEDLVPIWEEYGLLFKYLDNL